jgi:hypothetical protein
MMRLILQCFAIVAVLVLLVAQPAGVQPAQAQDTETIKHS